MRAAIEFGMLRLATQQAFELWQEKKQALPVGAGAYKVWRKANGACLVARASYDTAKLQEQCAHNRAWMHKL